MARADVRPNAVIDLVWCTNWELAVLIMRHFGKRSGARDGCGGMAGGKCI